MLLKYKLNASAQHVFEYLSDMQRFEEAHPMIYNTERSNENEYTFYENFKILFISNKFKYSVSVKIVEPGKTIEMYSKVKMGVCLTLNFSLHTQDDMTIVSEQVIIQAPFIIRKVFERILINAHQQLFSNIESIYFTNLPH